MEEDYDQEEDDVGRPLLSPTSINQTDDDVVALGMSKPNRSIYYFRLILIS